MMQRLLPYGLQNYLPDKIAKPIIELCSLFKQICSATLMDDDMLKAQIKVVDILYDLELIYPLDLFDIMIYLVIHLHLEALKGRPIRPRWMFPFERYMKKLKGYVRNKAKPEGSIAEGYVAEEALTFSSHYFWDVTMKFNRPDRNVDPPPPTCHPKIDTYRSQFKSLFPNEDMKEEFPEWFGSQIRQRHVDNDKDPEVNTTSELFALACGPTWTPISINSCVVDGVRYAVHSRDERRTTQNSGICLPGPDGEMYYENHREEEDQEGNNSPEIETLTYHTQFDLRPHMESPDWTEINAGIQQHLQKAYNTNKAAFKAQHWVIDPTTGTYNVEKIRRTRPEDITAEEWDKDPGRLLAFEMRWQSSGTQEYPSLIDTFYVAHTVNGEFLQDEDRRIYEEMRRLEATGTYTDDEINRLARRAGPSTPEYESVDDQEDEDEDGDGDS
ncbi:hypothetical protein Tco_1200700 [Tanacetum coccineum]